MYCDNCGTELEDGAKFCSKCGKKVSKSPNPNKKPLIICGVIIIALLVVIGVLAGKNAANKNADQVAENDQGTEELEETAGEADLDETESSGTEENVQDAADEESADESAAENSDESDIKTESDYEDEGAEFVAVTNPSLLGDAEEIYYNENLIPSVESYTIEKDLSNVVISPAFESQFVPESSYSPEKAEALRELLAKNSFAVDAGDRDDEFFDVYEWNRYQMAPNFITVDSLMHTYHLYFSYLMKNTEKSYLSDKLKELSGKMLDVSIVQYNELKGTDFEKAAFNNVVFFYVGSYLQDEKVKADIPDEAIITTAEEEIKKIEAQEGIDKCILTDDDEDYTQYKVRGYYEGDEQLEKYFKAMMWYGRIPFSIESEDGVRSAVLMSKAIEENADEWNSIYKITSFFAGASDDLCYDSVIDVVKKVYGDVPKLSKLVSDTGSFEVLCGELKKLNPPKINSVPVNETEENVILSYRFMGQRFTIDEAIMQQLVYRSVGENADGDRRYMPDALDTAAVLGSDTALDILDKQGATEFENYNENVTLLKSFYDNSESSLWNASLYAGWLNTLRPLLEKKGEGYPTYMQSEEWSKKNLETYAGSYAELKHDTILYAKELMAEMGGGDEEILDDRGYVDPEPVVYSRFIFLSNKTRDGLKEFGMLDTSSEEDLNKLSEIAKKLLKISEKELQNMSLDDEDYEFIRSYGGYLEHFWREVNKDAVDSISYSYQAPCPVVADIATDPNGSVLEVGSGNAEAVYVVFPIDGELHVGKGSVYSFYQFQVPISERMTDSEWRNALSGGYLDDDYNWVTSEDKPEHPEWAKSYRVFAEE